MTKVYRIEMIHKYVDWDCTFVVIAKDARQARAYAAAMLQQPSIWLVTKVRQQK